MFLPEPTKTSGTTHSVLAWDAAEGLYKWTETITVYTSQENLDRFKQIQSNIIAAEQAHNSQIVIDKANEELGWAISGEATR